MALVGDLKQALQIRLHFRPARSLIVELGQRPRGLYSIRPFFSNAHAGHRFAAILLVMQVAVLSSVGVKFHDASGLRPRGVLASAAGWRGLAGSMGCRKGVLDGMQDRAKCNVVQVRQQLVLSSKDVEI